MSPTWSQNSSLSAAADVASGHLAAEPTLVAFPLSLVPGSYDLVTNQNIQHGGTFGVKKILNLAQGDFTVSWVAPGIARA